MLTCVTGQTYTTLDRNAGAGRARRYAAFRVLLPIATTLRHEWASLGRWLTKQWFVPHTASTMTNRRWLRARDCISARRITISGLFVATQQFPLFLNDPFPSNYPFPVPGSALAIQRDLRTPYLQQWNFNVQRGLGSGRVLELTYAGTKGTKLVAARDINQPRPSTAPSELRPNPRFDDITILESRANSIYHSLQARFEQRFSRGLTALGSYTFGKSIDDASGFFASTGDPNFPQDSYNLRAERGRSNFDVRHRFSLSYSYDLPFRGSWLLRGWQTNGVWSFQTGRPFTVAFHPDNDNSNTGRSVLGFGANDRPNVVRSPELENPTEQHWFDTSAFVDTSPRDFRKRRSKHRGRAGTGGDQCVFSENDPSHGTLGVQLRAEAFNLLNRVNYDQPDNYVGSPSFGAILSAGSSAAASTRIEGSFLKSLDRALDSSAMNCTPSDSSRRRCSRAASPGRRIRAARAYDSMPRDIGSAIVKRPDDLPSGAVVTRSRGDLTVGHDLASRNPPDSRRGNRRASLRSRYFLELCEEALLAVCVEPPVDRRRLISFRVEVAPRCVLANCAEHVVVGLIEVEMIVFVEHDRLRECNPVRLASAAPFPRCVSDLSRRCRAAG